MKKKTLLAIAAAAAAVAFPLAASAQLTANVSLTSNYKFRGQDQDSIGSNGSARTKGLKPALQGGFDYAFGDTGFYVGNWNSSVHWLEGNNLETDFYGGYKFKLSDFDLDVGALTYVYSGNANGNTTELYGSAGWGPLVLKYSHTVSKDYFGWAGNRAGSGLKGTNTGYLNLAYSQEIIPKVTAKGAIGYTSFASDIKDTGVPNYVDYSVGAAYDFGDGLSLSGSVVGANKRSFFGFVNKNRFVVALTKTL